MFMGLPLWIEMNLDEPGGGGQRGLELVYTPNRPRDPIRVPPTEMLNQSGTHTQKNQTINTTFTYHFTIPLQKESKRCNTGMIDTGKCTSLSQTLRDADFGPRCVCGARHLCEQRLCMVFMVVKSS
jgi:hypothetical protein